VAEYRYSRQAESDADGIAAYTIEHWNKAQAGKYLGELEAFCQQLADGHVIRRPCDDISPGLFRAKYVSHVVFYRVKLYGVRIVRILGDRQLPELHSFEDEEEDENG
jgi:toxin ParE1/3/4